MQPPPRGKTAAFGSSFGEWEAAAPGGCRGMLSAVASGQGAKGLLGEPVSAVHPTLYRQHIPAGMPLLQKDGACGSPSCPRFRGEPAKGAELPASSALAAGAALGFEKNPSDI